MSQKDTTYPYTYRMNPASNFLLLLFNFFNTTTTVNHSSSSVTQEQYCTVVQFVSGACFGQTWGAELLRKVLQPDTYEATSLVQDYTLLSACHALLLYAQTACSGRHLPFIPCIWRTVVQVIFLPLTVITVAIGHCFTAETTNRSTKLLLLQRPMPRPQRMLSSKVIVCSPLQ
jgi:glucan phosphoethanolaminetransferase (alkaline phosphatase superfamily)